MRKEGTIRLRDKTYDYRIRIENRRVEWITRHGRLKELAISLDGRMVMCFGDKAVRIFPKTMEEMCVVACIFDAYYANPDNPDIPLEIRSNIGKEEQP